MIIPSLSPVYQHAFKHCSYIGCSTKEDWDFVRQHNILTKAVSVRHGIDPKISTGQKGFREKYGIDTPYMFLSCGGFWPNKAMNELVSVFNTVGRDDVTLVLTGYDNRHNIIPKESKYVKPLMLDDREDVLSAIRETDLYIMHSSREGFGLVLLESMLNKTPWASRNIAGARLMNEFGFTYETDEELCNYLKQFKGVSTESINEAYEYVNLNQTISCTVDDILRLVK
jgi:hypothetical protein